MFVFVRKVKPKHMEVIEIFSFSRDLKKLIVKKKSKSVVSSGKSRKKYFKQSKGVLIDDNFSDFLKDLDDH